MRAWIAMAVVAAGCSNFDTKSYIDPPSLRVIAVRAEPPEVAMGATTTLTAVVAAPLAAGVTIDWAICHQPPITGSGESVNPDCLKLETADFLEPAGSGASVTITMPQLDSPLALGLPDGSGGFYLPVRARARAGGQTLDTIYRVRLALGLQPPNHNPALTEFDYVAVDAGGAEVLTPIPDGAPFVIGLGEVRLRAQLTPESAERYLRPVGDPRDLMFESVIEQPSFDWYATFGRFTEDTTGLEQPSTTLELSEHHPPARGDVIDVWVVAQDERSGTDTMHRQLQLR